MGNHRAADRDLHVQRRMNPNAWLTDTLTKLVNRWPAPKIDDLMPWDDPNANAA